MANEQVRFEEVWPELSERLRHMLSRTDVDPWLAEDILQETGIRMLRNWSRCDPDRSLWGLTSTIARHLLWDHSRRPSRRESPAESTEGPGSSNTELSAIGRIELLRVKEALQELTPSQRRVLLAEVGSLDREAVDRLGTNKMQRMRARRKLVTLLERASGFVAGIRFRRPLAQSLNQPSNSGALASCIAACALAGVIITDMPSVIAPRQPVTSNHAHGVPSSSWRPQLRLQSLGHSADDDSLAPRSSKSSGARRSSNEVAGVYREASGLYGRHRDETKHRVVETRKEYQQTRNSTMRQARVVRDTVLQRDRY